MKPHGGYTGFVDGLSLLCRRWSRPLHATAMTLMLLALAIGASTANAATAPGSDAHVYLGRGVLNIFSLSFDEIAAKLRQQGINATVHNHLSWALLADQPPPASPTPPTPTITPLPHPPDPP